MMMRKKLLKDLLIERDLLPILTMKDGRAVTRELWPERRAEMLEALMRYSYGYTPEVQGRGEGTVASENPRAYGGKATEQQIEVSFDTPGGRFTLPVWMLIPHGVERPRVLLHLYFNNPVFQPPVLAEEITDNGYALAVVNYEDIVNDRRYGDYSDGLAKAFGTGYPRKPAEWGKIGMWAYGLSRVLDYLLTREDIDGAHTIVAGHSRLGKSALWAAAQDERFWGCVSNASGYGGAATSKHGSGERVTDFIRAGSWDWFCENFKTFTDEKENEKPYDQAYLLALIAPRLLCIGDASEDDAADPVSEYLTALWASKAWELLGAEGLVTPDRLPEVGDHFTEGRIGYHLRAGYHFFAREDWNRYMEFFREK